MREAICVSVAEYRLIVIWTIREERASEFLIRKH